MNRISVEAFRRPRAARTDVESLIKTSARLAVIGAGLVAMVVALDLGQMLLAPVALAIVIGLMFGPVADRLERVGLPPTVSAALVVILFVILVAMLLAGFAFPLSDWIDRIPVIWAKLRSEITDWQGLISSISGLQEQIRSMMGGKGQTVSVSEDNTMENVAFLAPAIIAQFLIFLASMYFFMATRHGIRVFILSLCFDRRLRWRVAHVFRDVEYLVSRYLLSITAVNAGLGVFVALGMWLAGIPSPLLWGLLAFGLNYIIYIGPMIMVAILLGVGLATATGWGILAPPAIYLFFNFLEAQFVTPHVIGRAMTLNPFIVFISLAFWIWLWGPIGGFIAVPMLLIGFAVINNVLINERGIARGRKTPARPAVETVPVRL